MFCSNSKGDTYGRMLDYEEFSARTNWSDDYLYDLDTSDYPFPNTLWHVKPAKEVALKTTAMLVVGVSGIFFNGVILLTLAKNKWLWTASNYLIGNLAVTDMLMLLLCPWFMLVRDFYQNYVLKNFGCRFEGFLQATMLLASVGAVMLVSYDRLAAAALPSDARVTKSAAPKLIFICWFVSICLSLPWIIKREYMERQWLDHIEMFCVEDMTVLGVYWHFTITMLVWIPLGVMVLTYGTIMWKLEWSARELSSRGNGQTIARARSRALRITACVLLTAGLCRVPYTVMVYSRNRNNMEINSVDGRFAVIWFVGNFLMYFNSAINPLIYGFTNLRFRRAMDRTPGVACCRFGTWCCVCAMFRRKEPPSENKNSEQIFVIAGSPKPNRKLTKAIKHALRINKDTLELSLPKVDDVTTKPTKVTPIKTEQV